MTGWRERGESGGKTETRCHRARGAGKKPAGKESIHNITFNGPVSGCYDQQRF